MSDALLGKMLLDLARDGSLVIDGRGLNQVHLGDPLTLEAAIREEWLALVRERQARHDKHEFNEPPPLREQPLGVEETAVLRVLSAEPGLVPVLQARLREHGGMRFSATEILIAVRLLCSRGLARKREDGYVRAERAEAEPRPPGFYGYHGKAE